MAGAVLYFADFISDWVTAINYLLEDDEYALYRGFSVISLIITPLLYIASNVVSSRSCTYYNELSEKRITWRYALIPFLPMLVVVQPIQMILLKRREVTQQGESAVMRDNQIPSDSVNEDSNELEAEMEAINIRYSEAILESNPQLGCQIAFVLIRYYHSLYQTPWWQVLSIALSLTSFVVSQYYGFLIIFKQIKTHQIKF